MSVYTKDTNDNEAMRVVLSGDSAASLPAWQTVWEYTIPSEAPLPSGPLAAIDPVLNTEPNTADSGWIRNGDDVEEWTNQSFTLSGDADLIAFVMNAIDDQGTNIQNDTFPFISPQAGEVRNIGAQFFGGYFRVVVQNVSGSTCNRMTATSKGGTASPMAVINSLDSPIIDSFPAPINRSVTVGRQPDGDYVNTPADGNIFSHGSPLAPSGTFSTVAFDTDGWKAIELYISTDQVSLQEGIVVEYTNDAQAASPTWFPGPKFTYGQDAVDVGFLIKRFAPALDGFRVSYTNGGVAQTSFYFSLELKNGITEPTSISIDNDIDPAISAQLTRGVDVAVNDSGTYGNITRGPLGGKRVSIYEHESETPIKPLNNLSGNASSVSSSTPTQIATAPPAGTKSIEIQADPDNTKAVYIGFNAGLTSGNAPVALTAGDARVYEVEGTPVFYALGASGSQSVRWTYIAEV